MVVWREVVPNSPRAASLCDVNKLLLICTRGWSRIHGAKLQGYRAQFPDRRMPDNRIFQLLHRELSEKRSFYVPRRDADRRRAVPSPSLEESTLNVVADRPKSST
ncbi:hypothetical protein TNCV_3008071 [Trichonephila clavipes]|nr:hypothetical protein TNCV_3008071 [Trichonephila clavipes]